MLRFLRLITFVLGISDLVTFTEGNEIGESYEGATVFKIHPRDSTEVDFLHDLMLTETQLDFWVEPRRTGDSVKFLAAKESIEGVKRKLDFAGLVYEESNRDLLRELRQEPIALRLRSFDSGETDLESFLNLDEINAYLRDAVQNCPSNSQCLLYSIGKSFEGRELFIFKISSKLTDTNRTGVWIDATLHAREWLTTATALKILDHLIHHRDENSRRLLNQHDWYIAPVMNPDGYVYTFKQRLWRKNRRTFENSSCIGVDLNRNFAYRWGREGANRNPCCETNCGPNSGSEPEVEAIQNEAVRLGPSLLGYVTLHAYGGMWMFPYGNTVNYKGKKCERTKDYQDLMDVANAAADAIEATFATTWRRGTTCEVIYPNSGSSLDYIKFIAGVKYTYALEIRGTGFNVDRSEIRPSFVEIWNGLVAMCDAISAKSNNSSQKINGGALFASLLFRWFGHSTEFSRNV